MTSKYLIYTYFRFDVKLDVLSLTLVEQALALSYKFHGQSMVVGLPSFLDQLSIIAASNSMPHRQLRDSRK